MIKNLFTIESKDKTILINPAQLECFMENIEMPGKFGICFFDRTLWFEYGIDTRIQSTRSSDYGHSVFYLSDLLNFMASDD